MDNSHSKRKIQYNSINKKLVHRMTQAQRYHNDTVPNSELRIVRVLWFCFYILKRSVTTETNPGLHLYLWILAVSSVLRVRCSEKIAWFLTKYLEESWS